jgi:hypothetical protein
MDTVEKSLKDMYNLGVSQSIDVIQDMRDRIKEGRATNEALMLVNLLDAAVTLLINLKK